jgi:uncharacterized protein (DUF885 family)
VNRILLAIVVALVLLSPEPDQAAPGHFAAVHTVTQLADAFVAEYKRRFPFQVMYTGMPLSTQSGVDINSRGDFANWRAFVYGLEVELKKISENALVGRPEWVTRADLLEGIAQTHMADTCQSELWNINPYGFVFVLPTVADSQPVTTAKGRREALARWHRIAQWLDQERANLALGLGRGYAAYRTGVADELSQVEAFIAQPYADWPTTVLAKRAKNALFTLELNHIATHEILPAAERFREFLKTEYLPHARTAPASLGIPQGMACLRARLATATTVEMEPKAMFDALVARRDAEKKRILELARQAYAVPDLTWEAFGEKLRKDPRDVYQKSDSIPEILENIFERVRTAWPRMMMTPPPGPIVVRPGPVDRYVPASDDGERPASYLYSGAGAHREAAESLIMHETIPGHYLLDVVRGQHRGALHPIARIIYLNGPNEGWATYAETWAAELRLYSGPFEEMGGLVNSVTPSAVAELGMQIAGWSQEQAGTYLRNETPFDSPTGEPEGVGAIVNLTGDLEAYPIGAMQYEAIRKRAQDALGSRFDSREYHQMLLSDGPLPFWALNAKVDRWLVDRR